MSIAFQVSVFTGLEAVIIGDKDHNFIDRSSVTFLAVTLLYLSDTMRLTFIRMYDVLHLLPCLETWLQ